MIRFRHIGLRLLVAVFCIVVIALVVIAVSYSLHQQEELAREAEASLAKVTDSVAEGMTAIMLGSHAKVAPEFATRLRNMPNVIDYRILRNDGFEAFIDNTTIDRVNDLLGSYEFTTRPKHEVAQEVLAATDPHLKQVLETGARVVFYQVLPGGERHITTLAPIKSEAVCAGCHGKGESVHGVIKLTTSLKEVDRDVERSWWLSIGVIVAALAGIVGLIYWVAHRAVVSHIVAFSKAMETAAQGDMSIRLPVRSKDEIGNMAHSFNEMNQELEKIYAGLREERNKLSSVIQGASSGIVVTDAQRTVVLVNEAAERILGKSAPHITREGFMALFDDPAWMEERLGRENNTGEIRTWHALTLSVQVSTINDTSGATIGSAALLRDVTEEKRLENALKIQSITDALTGLHNRRHFNEVIQTEFKRWERYAQPLSVMMIDVDHFKRFNDTYGHECGDRVLGAIGEVLRNVGAPSLIPCRYGGEEMVVVLPGCPQDKACEVAEAIRLKIAALVIDGLKVTVSIGVAGAADVVQHGIALADGDALVKLADEALYRAKEGGRNRVAGG